MSAPAFVPTGAPVYGPAPARAPVARAAPAPRRSAPTAQAAAAPRPVVRAAPPDDSASRPAPLVMPSPERLGVGLPHPAGGTLDVSTIARRLQELGASGYHLDRVPEGGYRFTCWVPGSQPGISRRVEATAATESEAARLALSRAAQDSGR